MDEEEDPPENDRIATNTLPRRTWTDERQTSHVSRQGKGRHLGTYALTSSVSSWAADTFNRYQPSEEVLHFVKPFAKEFHDLAEDERKSSSGLHDIDTIELTYQYTLE